MAPTLANFALRSARPNSALLILGLRAPVVHDVDALVRTLLMASPGLLLSTVGIDVMIGHFRFTFDIKELGDGIDFLPIAMGLFGISEILTIARQVRRRRGSTTPARPFPERGMGRSVMPIMRGSVLGFFVGLLPGPCTVISTFVSYALEKKMSKNPGEFGKGAVEGVVGPESANNSAVMGSMIPLLTLGIPFAAPSAIMLAGLRMHNVEPGPMLFATNPDVFWTFIAAMYIGNFMLLVLNLPLVGLFVNVLRIPYAYLYPLIIMFCIIGVYEVNHSIVDVWIMLIMGALGYLLRKFDFDPAPWCSAS